MNPGLLALLKWEADCERECPLEFEAPRCSPPCSPIHKQERNLLSPKTSLSKSSRRDAACEASLGPTSPRGNLTALTSQAFQIVRSPSNMSNTGGALSFCLDNNNSLRRNLDNSLRRNRAGSTDACDLVNESSG